MALGKNIYLCSTAQTLDGIQIQVRIEGVQQLRQIWRQEEHSNIRKCWHNVRVFLCIFSSKKQYFVRRKFQPLKKKIQ
jgi:hypothetical protein